MALPLGIILGIVTMVCWGAADFFAAKAVRKANVYKTLLWSQIVALLAFVPVMYFFFEVPLLSFYSIGVVLITGFLGIVAYLSYYKGLRIGKVSVVSPMAACWGAVTFILSLVFLGESVTMIQALGVSLAILGAVVVSFRWRDLFRMRNIAAGAKLGAIAALGWGVYFVFVDVLVSELSWLIAIFLVKAASVFYFLSYYNSARKDFSLPGNVMLLVISIGILETIGFLAYGLGVTTEYTAIVAPVGAAFPAVTVVLARIFFREKLDANQDIGIVSVLSGLILLSL